MMSCENFYRRIKKLIKVLILLAVIIPGCRSNTSAVRAVAMLPEVDSTLFDPQTFLCELSGRTVSESDARAIGQRYRPEERARARIIIARELRRIGLSPREHTYENGREVFYPAPGYYPGEGTARGVNLYAELPATMPTNDWIVIGGHYDTVLGTPGADDNASGVTAVLLVATELLRVPERRANLIFVFFDQEEVGLVGSDMFAQRLLDQGRNIITFHNIDMVGWDGDHDRDIVLMHGVSLVPPLDDRYMRLYTQAAQFLRTESGRDCRPGEILRSDTNRGEHITFEMHGIQAVTVIEEFAEEGDFNPYYHQLGDSCDRLDYSYLRLCADLVVAVVTRQLQ